MEKIKGLWLDEVAKHLASQDAPTVSSVGGEWTVLGLARAGKIK